jgi:hypothetical protein
VIDVAWLSKPVQLTASQTNRCWVGIPVVAL